MIYFYITIFILSLYVTAGMFLYLFQDKIIFLPGKEIFKTPSDEGMEFEDIDLHTTDGLTLNAWYIPHDKAKKTVLFCHGNAGTLSHMTNTIKLLHDMKLSLFIFDYRGYGISEGTPSEKGTYIDAASALKYLIEELKIPEKDIVIWGRSLGGPIAANLAKNNNTSSCVLESTFTSIADIAKKRFKIFPSKLLSRYNYRTIDYVKEINTPILIVHSPDDEVVPYSMGEAIFKNCLEPKSFLKLHGDHNNAYFDSIDQYKKGIEVVY